MLGAVSLLLALYAFQVLPISYAGLGLILLGIALMIRYNQRGKFKTTPTDFLIIIAVVILAILSSQGAIDTSLTAITLKAIILFYATELVLSRMTSRLNVFTLSVLFSLSIISIRGLYPYLA